MSRHPESFDGNSDAGDTRPFVAEPLRDDGDLGPLLDVIDLDPPTPLPPCPVS